MNWLVDGSSFEVGISIVFCIIKMLVFASVRLGLK